MRMASLTSPVLFLPLLTLAAAPFACANPLQRPDLGTGAGGDAGAGSAGGMGGAGGLDGGPDVTPGSPCTTDLDCVPLEGPCSDGVCAGDNGCQLVPKNDFGPCDDGLFCTVNDVCLSGACTAGTSMICPSNGEACKIGSCNEATDACEFGPVNEGGFCDDGDPCTELGVCKAGACQLGPKLDCSFLNNLCSVGTCDPVVGCIAVPQNDGVFCDDTLFCTVEDVCISGQCVGTPNPCTPTADPCKNPQCDEIQKTCVAIAGNDGAACEDGNACTAGEVCAGGACSSGAPVPPGTTCNDNKACTTGETCEAGTCGGGAPILACAHGDGCCPAGCDLSTDDDCKLLKIGVMGGPFYVDDLRAHLATQPFVGSAVVNTDCSLATLQTFDVVILHGQMSCFSPSTINTYVQGGGGVIATPWMYSNYGDLDALPVTGKLINSFQSYPLNVTVTDPTDVLLEGVTFQNGDFVGWEEIQFTLKPGAKSSVVWLGDLSRHAVAKWQYGSGRVVYLDFHYLTSDCSLASGYTWGKQLAYNATLWAGKVL
ncbi:hypothetical protein [Polyangium mundeleinium]|uniref:Disintegrin domain-containing protein n=1 Tax=Polyangium mundeleinium TaxID=2995306 RepID=A0ABT5F7T0_9BACT|nr:hypothetical protein [Polyangium mundeleinium]MDC0749557.1 hypothetical protein [Polyangium mundeleinium]